MGRRPQQVVKVGPENRARMLAMSVEEREVVLEACLLAMADGETLAQWCIAEGYAPNTVRMWFATYEGWRERYFATRMLQGQAFADEAIRVARETTNFSSAADRVLIETLKWAAAKAHPMEFGDRQMVEHRGNQRLEVVVVEEEGTPRVPLAVEKPALVSGAIGGDVVDAEVISVTAPRRKKLASGTRQPAP